jgi:acetyl-CoA C-acetyltransferase
VFADVALASKCRMLMMGSGADLIATQYNVSREAADLVAYTSQQRAALARDNGWFKSIIPVHNKIKDTLVEHDECIREQTTCESLAELEPSFAKLGAKGIDALQLQANPEASQIQHVHTAGNSPAMADAAALVLVGNESLQSQGLKPRARIVSATSICDDPLTVISGCAAATKKLLDEQGLSSDDIDLFEMHEAFAATVIKCQRDLNISDEKLNVNGGVIALGHPMGATGAIMLGVLLDELERRDLKTGIVAASGAAGTGTAMLIERV